ncbi:MAG TPA: amidohydrolase family protein [Gaiellaceae bacterium]|nr:amidohydrolase family protein [Gaiellaceae bacterium]
MTTVLIRGLAGLVTGRLGEPFVETDSLLLESGRIASIGDGASGSDAVVVLDAAGAIAAPGLIDSHSHVVFGDWTPRQQTIGWIESTVHGGVTTLMSASEVHLPGRPSDPAGVKALALAAHRSYAAFRPGGMKVLGGSVIIEPGLTEDDFAELAREGVWLAKVGFGAWSPQGAAAPAVRSAQRCGFLVMTHTGGASIPGSSPVTIDDVVTLGADIIGHANGGTTALPDGDLPRLIDETKGTIQLVQAGNLRSALAILGLARERGALGRIVIATDTPSGTGVMPLGMIKSVVELSSLGDLAPTDALALATGNAGAALRLEQGVLEVGRPADVVLLQAPLGGSKSDALAAIANGDIPSIVGTVIDGVPRAFRSRNTPAPIREVIVEKNAEVRT